MTVLACFHVTRYTGSRSGGFRDSLMGCSSSSQHLSLPNAVCAVSPSAAGGLFIRPTVARSGYGLPHSWMTTLFGSTGGGRPGRRALWVLLPATRPSRSRIFWCRNNNPRRSDRFCWFFCQKRWKFLHSDRFFAFFCQKRRKRERSDNFSRIICQKWRECRNDG